MKSVILAGGSGSHLWPLSREKYPKPFLKLGDYSLFQQAFLRCLKISSIEEIFVVTNEDLKFYVAGQIQELDHILPWKNILIEPATKNTLPAICLAIKEIHKRFNNTAVAVFPSDHILGNNTIQIIQQAENLAKQGYLVAFGVKPTSPNTKYGYIKGGEPVGIGKKITKFYEKPEKKSAQVYINDGFVWNSGIFLFTTDTFFSELQHHSPEIYQVFHNDTNLIEAYDTIFPVSIDYAIVEKTNNGVVVLLNDTWNDLDDFSDLYEQSEKDDYGNVIFYGEFLSQNAKNDLIFSKNGKLISLIDVHDHIVVDSGDVLLITPKESSGKVKEIFDQLKQKNDERALLGLTVYRPWGWYAVMESSSRHLIKKICVFPGHELSHQLHYHRSEHWVVVTGTAKVIINGEEFFVRPGESTFIRAGEKHKLSNPSKTIPLDIIEVQLGEYINEDDIVRFTDKYGRK
jgi:mannose-1-phosphate guanylyltransferase / mannose-6-phosphate isomerase